MNRFRLVAFSAAVFGLAPASSQVSAQAPTVTDTVSVLSNQSANSGNFATGPILFQRATVDPTSPIFGFARQSGVGEALFFRPDANLPNQVFFSLPYTNSSTLTGPWALTVSTTQNFANGTVTSINTPAVGTVGVMPFVNQMTITPGTSPLNPVISWVLPNPSNNPGMPTISQFQISVSDYTKGSTIPVTNIDPFTPQNAAVPFGQSFQQANIIYSSTPSSPSITSFTIPTTNDNPGNANFGQTVLQYGHNYSIGIQLQNVVPGSTPVPGCALCTVDSRSVSYFDYSPKTNAALGLPPGAVINLPTTIPIPSTSGQFAGPLYSFNVSNVGPSFGVTYIDPVVATGFVYTKGARDPNFAGVIPITNVGDGVYQLLVWDGTKFVLRDGALRAGEMFNFLTDGFDPNGVTEFEITGIDPAAGLSPTDITAFVTGLTFITDGSFTGTMQALATTVSVPGPIAGAGLPGLVLAFGGLLTLGRRQRRKGDCITMAPA